MASCVQYSHLYRVLRSDENVLIGIRAKNPSANYTLEQHVGNGSYMSTQFISTTASMQSAKDFARKSFRYTPGSRRVAVINTGRLGASVLYTDLTDPGVRHKAIPTDARAQNFARHFKEVVIEGNIPADCIDQVIKV